MGGETTPAAAAAAAVAPDTAGAAAPAPAPSAPSAPAPTLTMKFEAEYEAYVRDATTATAVCHIEAPDEEETAAAANPDADVRAAVDLVAVIDVSGSMSGAKLALVKKTLEFIIRNLRAEDRLGLVAFDSNVTTPLALLAMDAKGKDSALRATEALRAGTCTNLSGGLFEGMSMMKGRPAATRNAVGTVMLLTDGMANEGIRDEAKLAAATRKLLGEDAGYTVYTFGYGSSHQATLLKQLAEVGGGMYYYIENDEAVPPSFGDCLGGLLTTVAQNVQVTLRASPGTCAITKVETTRAVTLRDGGAEATVALGDLQAEEFRDLVLRLALKGLPPAYGEAEAKKAKEQEGASGGGAAAAAAAAPLPHLTATVTYVNVLTGSFETREAVLSLARPASVPAVGQPASEMVREQMRRLETTAAIRDAITAAERGDMARARERLRVTESAMAECNDAYTSALRADLTECMTSMVTPQAYAAKGAYACHSAVQSHSMQRANRVFTEEEEQQGRTSYVTKKKGAWRGFSKAFASSK